MRPSSMNERIEIGIFRFFRCFSRMYKNGVRYKAERIGERADPWPTPTLTSNMGKKRSFTKKEVTLGLRPAFSRMRVRSWWLSDGKNCDMSNARELDNFPLAYPDQTI